MATPTIKKEELVWYLQSRLNDYEQPVTVFKGYDFSLKDTINQIELYRASRFQSWQFDALGNQKFFLNISNPQCWNATKNIDLDRKDIRARATDGNDFVKSLIYNAELKQWMRKNKVNVLLNKLSENLPIYGSVVFKKEMGAVKYIPLRNLIIAPWVSNQDLSFDIQSPYIIQKHLMQPEELEQLTNTGDWIMTEVDKAISDFRKYAERKGDSEMIVYEVYWTFKNSCIGKPWDWYSKAKIYMSCGQYDDDTKDYAYSWVFSVQPVKKFPYKKIDYLTIEGRALGLGIMEMLFDPQQRWNEISNQRANSMKLASRHLYQTRDSNVERNLLTDVLDGDVLKVSNEITPVATEDRNLAAYNQEENSLMNIIRSNANAFETLTGESLPSGTPYRLWVMLGEQWGKLFEYIRENIGNFLEEVFTEWVIPEFDKTLTTEHIFELLDTDTIEYIVEKDVNRRLNEAIKKYVIKTWYYPSPEIVQVIRDAESRPWKTLFVKIIKWYLNFNKDVEINITGESTNIANRIETVSNLLQLLAQNPQMTELPQTKKLFARLLDDVGLSWADISGWQMPALNQIQPWAVAWLWGNVPLAQ